MWACACHRTCGGQRKRAAAGSLLPPGGSEDEALVVKLGGKPLSSLSHTTGPREGLLQIRVQENNRAPVTSSVLQLTHTLAGKSWRY